MKKVFRRALFVEDSVREGLTDSVAYIVALVTWAKWYDGIEVIDGRIDDYTILDDWCEFIEE